MNQNIKESDVSEENAKYLYLKYKGKYSKLKNKLKGNGPNPPATPAKTTSMFKSMSGMSTSLFKKSPPPVQEKASPGLTGKMERLKSKIDANVSEADLKFKETITNLSDYFNAMKNIEQYNNSIEITYEKYFKNIGELQTITGDFKDQSPDEIRVTQEVIKKNLEIKEKLKQKIEVIEKLNEECKTHKLKLINEEAKIKNSEFISFKKNIQLDCLSPPDEKKLEETRKKFEEEKKRNKV